MAPGNKERKNKEGAEVPISPVKATPQSPTSSHQACPLTILPPLSSTISWGPNLQQELLGGHLRSRACYWKAEFAPESLLCHLRQVTLSL